MCGIIGVYSNEKKITDRFIAEVSPRISHRGPDGSKGSQFLSGKLSLLHYRLAFQDLNDRAGQPMPSSCGRFVILFNGEIYNFKELKQELIESGEVKQWSTNSDTELLAELISCRGLNKTIDAIDGMYALSVFDKKKVTISLSVDRFGQKPLYYQLTYGQLVFSSELRWQKTINDEHLSISPHGLAAYMNYGFIAAPLTIFAGVHKIVPGTTRTFKLSEGAKCVSEELNYQPSRRLSKGGNFKEKIYRLDNLMAKSVSNHLISDVPVGAFLSGGIDSSLVCHYAARAVENLKTFSIGFDSKSHDESNYAKSVAKQIGSNHHELKVHAELIKQAFERCVAAFDEPFGDFSQILSFLVSDFARNEVKAVLSGDGGDEVFCGYNRHSRGPSLLKLTRFFEALGLHTFLNNLKFPKFVTSDLQSRHADISLRLNRILCSLKTTELNEFYLSFLQSGYLGKAINLKEVEGTYSLNHLLTVYDLQESSLDVFEIDFLDRIFYLPFDILTKVDRASMHFGLEVRSPFLSKEVVKFSLAEFSYSDLNRYGGNKAPLRYLAKNKLPETDFSRPKRGFGFPINLWLSNELKPMVLAETDSLPKILEGYVNHKSVQKIVSDFMGGHHARGDDVWRAMCLYRWGRSFEYSL